MIADMICGPAFIVMARGMMARFMISPHDISLLCATDYWLASHQ
jgi:hypothetical protein